MMVGYSYLSGCADLHIFLYALNENTKFEYHDNDYL